MDDAVFYRCACGHSFSIAAPSGPEVTCPECKKPVPPPPAPAKTESRRPTSRRRLPPTPIPGYVFLKRVGVGGMGEVYLARQESLDRQVAVKLLPPEFARDRAYVDQFLKEARSAGKLSHENIVGAVDVGEAGGRYYFVMEYVSGETLYRLVKHQGPLPEAKALDFARQIARGLQHAHRNGLIHRDIKPKNILVTAEGTAKICDFGLARDVSPDAAPSPDDEDLIHSTPAYASPEQCLGEALDHRTDLYSLGVTLFEILAGRRPFSAEDSRDLMKKHVTEEPPSLRSLAPSVSAETERLVLRLLRKKREERFKDYDELLAAIDAAGKPPATKTVREATPPPPARTRRLAPWIAGGAAAALGIGVLAFFLLSGDRAKPPATAAAPAPAGPDAETRRLLEEVRRLDRDAEGRPSEYAAVRARLKALEERYRGKPEHGIFTTELMEFDSRVASEAGRVADQVVRDANRAIKSGRAAEAHRELKRFPPELARTDAGVRVADRLREIERTIDDAFREGVQACVNQLALEKFGAARAELQSLKLVVSYTGPEGPKYVRSQHPAELETLQKKIDEEELLARQRAAQALSRLPEPRAQPAVPPPPVPPPAPPPTTAAKAPVAAPPNASPAAPHMFVLRDAAQRVEPDKRAAAAAFFSAGAGKSGFYRAASLFLARDEASWKIEAAAEAALGEYLAAPALLDPEALKPAQHRELLELLAAKISGLGGAPPDALQFFACAHIDEILAHKGKIDPAVALQARLGKAPLSELWGPTASVARVEMARFLVRPPGLWISRASEAAAGAPDFPSRLLATLLLFKEPAFDPALAADRWKKLGASAPDASWTKVCDGAADRLRLAIPCETCSGQGRHPCPSCAASGIAACVPCKGAGRVTDAGDLSERKCGACSGRRTGACPACGGKQSVKCLGCDGKKSRATLPGGPFRYLMDLGACEACQGEATLFANAAWPCDRCDGNGRVIEAVARDFPKIPAWTRGRDGRAAAAALRWLARHQAPDGHWGAASWAERCRGAGCGPAPAIVNGILDPTEVGLTSLALLAFLGAGFGPDSDVPIGGAPAGLVVRRALSWLLACQKGDGSVLADPSSRPMLEHLLATYALSVGVAAIPAGESFGEKDRVGLREAATRALRFALQNQHRGAGWSYSMDSPTSDSWVTGLGALALLAARDAGLDVPRTNLGSLVAWFDASTDRSTLMVLYAPPALTRQPAASELLSRPESLSTLGGIVRILIEGKATAALAAAEKLVMREIPGPEAAKRDFVYWHTGTLFLAHREQRRGSAWTLWSQSVGRELGTLQDLTDSCALGSWAPNDRWSIAGGRVYATVVNALTLETAAGIRPLAYSKK